MACLNSCNAMCARMSKHLYTPYNCIVFILPWPIPIVKHLAWNCKETLAAHLYGRTTNPVGRLPIRVHSPFPAMAREQVSARLAAYVKKAGCGPAILWPNGRVSRVFATLRFPYLSGTFLYFCLWQTGYFPYATHLHIPHQTWDPGCWIGSAWPMMAAIDSHGVEASNWTSSLVTLGTMFLLTSSPAAVDEHYLQLRQ